MTSQDFLFYSLGAGFLILVGFSFKNKFNDLKKQGQKIISDIQNKADELTATGKEKVDSKVKRLRSNLEGYKKTIKSKL